MCSSAHCPKSETEVTYEGNRCAVRTIKLQKYVLSVSRMMHNKITNKLDSRIESYCTLCLTLNEVILRVRAERGVMKTRGVSLKFKAL